LLARFSKDNKKSKRKSEDVIGYVVGRGLAPAVILLYHILEIKLRRIAMPNGFLIINKESGMTSHDVVNKIRKTLQTKQVGHTGTLDPNATGVLIVAVGKATKAITYLENDDKIYEAELTLGIITDT
jgi:hypothetical protein